MADRRRAVQRDVNGQRIRQGSVMRYRVRKGGQWRLVERSDVRCVRPWDGPEDGWHVVELFPANLPSGTELSVYPQQIVDGRYVVVAEVAPDDVFPPRPGDVWGYRGWRWTVRSVAHPESPSGAVRFEEFVPGKGVRNFTSVGAMRNGWTLISRAPAEREANTR